MKKLIGQIEVTTMPNFTARIAGEVIGAVIVGDVLYITTVADETASPTSILDVITAVNGDTIDADLLAEFSLAGVVVAEDGTIVNVFYRIS